MPRKHAGKSRAEKAKGAAAERRAKEALRAVRELPPVQSVMTDEELERIPSFSPEKVTRGNSKRDVILPKIPGAGSVKPITLSALREDSASWDAMLAWFRLGASIGSVAGRLGVSSETIRDWLAKGSEQHVGIFREFFVAVVGEIGEARATAEAKVAAKDPLTYLRMGSARVLGDEWRDDPTSKVQGVHVSASLTAQVTAPPEDLIKAIAHLKEAGVDLSSVVDTYVLGTPQDKLPYFEGQTSINDSETELLDVDGVCIKKTHTNFNPGAEYLPPNLSTESQKQDRKSIRSEDLPSLLDQISRDWK